jgi:hypothetical protein
MENKNFAKIIIVKKLSQRKNYYSAKITIAQKLLQCENYYSAKIIAARRLLWLSLKTYSRHIEFK